jgi:DNA-binding LacI/PurR family transcriptional regulator
MAAWHSFALTTIGYDPSALAHLATEKILGALERNETAPGSFHIQPELIIRQTTP